MIAELPKVGRVAAPTAGVVSRSRFSGARRSGASELTRPWQLFRRREAMAIETIARGVGRPCKANQHSEAPTGPRSSRGRPVNALDASRRRHRSASSPSGAGRETLLKSCRRSACCPVRGSQEVSDRILLELLELLHARRRLAHWRRTTEASGTDSAIGLSSP